VIVLVAAIGIIGGTASRIAAHHSFSATYLEDQSITIEGDVVQYLFRNPHSFVHVNVIEKNGSCGRRYRNGVLGKMRMIAMVTTTTISLNVTRVRAAARKPTMARALTSSESTCDVGELRTPSAVISPPFSQ
jgi:hypothetical protein